MDAPMALSETEILAQVERALEGSRPRAEKLQEVADILRKGRGDRWVGIYEVTADGCSLVAWSGPGPPAHPRLPIAEGLCGAAVREKKSIVVGDVAADQRYRTTFPSTRSEIVVPILDVVDGRARGMIDVESDRLNAFGEDDRAFLEHCAAVLATDMSPSPG
jgi:L-methionine (R)-S-oxide reductase